MTTHTTQTTELPKHISDEFDKEFGTGGLTFTSMYPEDIKKWFAQTLETEVQKAVEAERKRWHSPFDGLEIKLMYRDGDKVLQNKHIFSLEQISFVKGFFEVVQLKFSYMLKDLLANSLSHKEQA